MFWLAIHVKIKHCLYKNKHIVSHIKLIIKENQQGGTILAIQLNDVKMTFRVIRKTLIKFYL